MIAFGISIILLIVLAIISHLQDRKPTDRKAQEFENTEFDYGHNVNHKEE